MREEDIDPSEGMTRVRCHIRHEPQPVEETGAPAPLGKEEIANVVHIDRNMI